ncbi:alpha/beta fold hydrolase [Aneurinibacillus sp. REN35]|uniref:alpha/beta fold hydrolase n=1 Tax=Aneurinibacillus sp. REN35 TaxID=3237286 RepID=UPI00352736D1
MHYIDAQAEMGAVPALVICPGLSEPAENYRPILSALTERRTIALSFRGRGKSDAPKTGYSLEQHIEDIRSVVKSAQLPAFYLLGYSRGVSYALGFALRYPDRIKGLILAEYPAEHKKMPHGWADEYMASYWGEQKGSELMKAHVVNGIEQDARQVDFWEVLSQVSCPVLLLRGTGIESLLSAEQAARYIQCLSQTKVQLEVFEGAGHTVKEFDLDRFVRTIREFLFGIEAELSSDKFQK